MKWINDGYRWTNGHGFVYYSGDKLWTLQVDKYFVDYFRSPKAAILYYVRHYRMRTPQRKDC